MITPRIEEEAKLTIKELEDGRLPSEQKGEGKQDDERV